ncbi:MAG: M61 family metallopeptidase [Bacteroidetes bacterium]|nr:M61 family metallopeptidase [Bacteroidota bacterium]
MKYRLQFNHPHEKLISVSLDIQLNTPSVRLHLPMWRPGRYELQNYAKNVADVKVSNQGNGWLEIEKMGTNIWELRAEKKGKVQVSYTYFANVLDAGGSYIDENNIYVNGINVFMYVPELIDSSCELTIDWPDDFTVGGGLPGEGPKYEFENFHQLVDTPFLAGRDLIHHQFEVEGVSTHLWFMGECQPVFRQMEKDIKAYTRAQIALFGEFPVPDYHYLYVILPHHYRHGVEHYNSTVIVMGPGYRLMQPRMYKSWLEISSHELFHTWNVKALRPEDMFPYDYDRENYSKLHYITEGVTTYYGDLMLWKGKNWDLQDWINSINGELKTFYAMGGKDEISLTQASMDSWVNGYKKSGNLNRRVSFYTKGYLVAMLIDFEIRRGSKNQYSLDNVMREMYHQIAKKNRGYNREDFKGLVEKFSGKNFDQFFANYVEGTENLQLALMSLADYMGFDVMMIPPGFYTEYWWGVETHDSSTGTAKIDNIYEHSPGLKAGLTKDDEIIAIEGIKVENNLEELLHYFRRKRTLKVHFFHLNKLKSTKISRWENLEMLIPQFKLKSNPFPEQSANLLIWQAIKIKDWANV